MSKLHITTGTILQIGSHIVGCGDSTDSEFVAKVVGKVKVKQILTDPPYGIDYVASKEKFAGHKSKHVDIENDHFQSDSAYQAFSKKWLDSIKSHLSAKNIIYCFNADRMIFALREGMLEAGFHRRRHSL